MTREQTVEALMELLERGRDGTVDLYDTDIEALVEAIRLLQDAKPCAHDS